MKVNCIFFVIIFIFILNSCSSNESNLEFKIRKDLEKECTSKCTLDLNNYLSFEWEHMYVFRETASLNEIEVALETKYPNYGDIARRIVFIDKNDSIVHREEVFPNVEGIVNKQILFSISDGKTYTRFSNRLFFVERKQKDNIYYYLVTQ